METPSIAEILLELELNSTEAKILYALTQTGTATAKIVADASGIAREIVYQTTAKLKEKGLVEEILTSPKKFKASSVDKYLFALLKNKKEEQRELLEKLKRVLSSLKGKNPNPIDVIESISLFSFLEKQQLSAE